jgi:phage repressor protein C with HTH and peptisase S24 domain
MHSLKLKQVDIYQRLGVSRGTASAWANGTNIPTGDNLERLARALDCSPKWLMFGGDEGKETRSLGLDSSALGEPAAHTFVDVPVYNVELSAGNGFDAGEVEIIDYHPISTKILEDLGMSLSESAVMKVKGDSMEETLWNNDLLLVQTSIKKPISNKIFAFAFENELRVKRFSKKMDGAWRVISDNHDKSMYPDEFISHMNIDSVNIIGHVRKVIDRSL